MLRWTPYAFGEGPSPRRRGNHDRTRRRHDGAGPIPAQAGEPPLNAPQPSVPAAHPRAGGGTPDVAPLMRRLTGPSPRRRGNLEAPLDVGKRAGPIPAQAGEPAPATARWTAIPAHPRAGGGTFCPADSYPSRDGPSPRRRGNLSVRAQLRDARGPIPAQAGEPVWTAGSSPGEAAHPRAGGGTSPIRSVSRPQKGPSPRRRGNRSTSGSTTSRRRPIPAQAGEPCAGRAIGSGRRAHPRAGGGTSIWSHGRAQTAGPSPRRRGNHRAVDDGVTNLGPIPAQAGEPERDDGVVEWGGAHPRAGGGTMPPGRHQPPRNGPSPRRRGNRRGGVLRALLGRPIPAQAGEPWTTWLILAGRGAHPRAGGGTLEVVGGGIAHAGPSPRRRGNHRRVVHAGINHGPIPAQAGEPSAGRGLRSRARAHPRAGGGT